MELNCNFFLINLTIHKKSALNYYKTVIKTTRSGGFDFVEIAIVNSLN